MWIDIKEVRHTFERNPLNAIFIQGRVILVGFSVYLLRMGCKNMPSKIEIGRKHLFIGC